MMNIESNKCFEGEGAKSDNRLISGERNEKFDLASSFNDISIIKINKPILPFVYAMDMLMSGYAIAYNIQRKHVYELPKTKRVRIKRKDSKDADFIVPDTRQGWVELLERTLTCHFITGNNMTYSTICIRDKGRRIKGFGGTSAGPEELCNGINIISEIINDRASKKLRPIDCLYIMETIGKIVSSGDVRTVKQICIGDYDDVEYSGYIVKPDKNNIIEQYTIDNNSEIGMLKTRSNGRIE